MHSTRRSDSIHRGLHRTETEPVRGQTPKLVPYVDQKATHNADAGLLGPKTGPKNKPDQVLRQRCELVVKHSISHDRAPLSPQEPHRSSHMNSWGPERVNK